jgi:thiol peroxidase
LRADSEKREEDKMAQITFKGNPVNTSGELPEVGANAPDFLLTKTDMTDVTLNDFKGKKLVLNIFISIETPVCAESVRRFNNEIKKYENTEVLCVSRDLPFAHARFNMDEGLENVISLSELRNLDFGRDYGLRLVDGSMAGLLARALVVIDEDGKVSYTELVPEIGEEPDYDSALNILSTGTVDPDLSAQTRTESDPEVCNKAPEYPEHHRLEDDDDYCDDGRSGKI